MKAVVMVVFAVLVTAAVFYFVMRLVKQMSGPNDKK
ncbi:MAG: hypothetical protein ACI9GW_000120 [Halieaceae bacterium]|jgi:hypothetical protein